MVAGVWMELTAWKFGLRVFGHVRLDEVYPDGTALSVSLGGDISVRGLGQHGYVSC
jgi:hypothetical protein